MPMSMMKMGIILVEENLLYVQMELTLEVVDVSLILMEPIAVVIRSKVKAVVDAYRTELAEKETEETQI